MSETFIAGKPTPKLSNNVSASKEVVDTKIIKSICNIEDNLRIFKIAYRCPTDPPEQTLPLTGSADDFICWLIAVGFFCIYFKATINPTGRHTVASNNNPLNKQRINLNLGLNLEYENDNENFISKMTQFSKRIKILTADTQNIGMNT